MMHEISTYSYAISTICYLVAILCFMATAFKLKNRIDDLDDRLNYEIHRINKTMEIMLAVKLDKLHFEEKTMEDFL